MIRGAGIRKCYIPFRTIMPHFVYMLRCAGNRIYTGYAVDVAARFEEHRTGRGAKFTKAFPPEKILRQFELPSKEYALRMEARIKKLATPQKELLAQGDEELTQSLLDSLAETLPPKKRKRRKPREQQCKRKNESGVAAQKNDGGVAL